MWEGRSWGRRRPDASPEDPRTCGGGTGGGGELIFFYLEDPRACVLFLPSVNKLTRKLMLVLYNALHYRSMQYRGCRVCPLSGLCQVRHACGTLGQELD